MWLLLYWHAEPRENTEIFFWYNHVLYVLSRLDETGQTVSELFPALAYCGRDVAMQPSFAAAVT